MIHSITNNRSKYMIKVNGTFYSKYYYTIVGNYLIRNYDLVVIAIL